jgi:hypothetical protein
MLILDLLRTEIAERGLQSAGVVDLIDLARKVVGYIDERLMGDRIDGLDLKRFHEALGHGAITGTAAAPHQSKKAVFGESLPVAPGSGLGGDSTGCRDSQRLEVVTMAGRQASER